MNIKEKLKEIFGLTLMLLFAIYILIAIIDFSKNVITYFISLL